MTYYDVTNSVYPITLTIIRHSTAKYSRISLIRYLKGIRKKWRIRRSDELCRQVKTLS